MVCNRKSELVAQIKSADKILLRIDDSATNQIKEIMKMGESASPLTLRGVDRNDERNNELMVSKKPVKSKIKLIMDPSSVIQHKKDDSASDNKKFQKSNKTFNSKAQNDFQSTIRSEVKRSSADKSLSHLRDDIVTILR